jgi:hypothetical protein
MAGFPGKAPYWVGRSMLPLQHSIGWYEARILPELETWRQQASSANGDKSLLCNKVLNHIIPYMITVLVQDGIYFTREFPDHETSILLSVSTMTYMCLLTVQKSLLTTELLCIVTVRFYTESYTWIFELGSAVPPMGGKQYCQSSTRTSRCTRRGIVGRVYVPT